MHGAQETPASPPAHGRVGLPFLAVGARTLQSSGEPRERFGDQQHGPVGFAGWGTIAQRIVGTAHGLFTREDEHCVHGVQKDTAIVPARS